MNPVNSMLDFHAQALTLRADRQRTIASNIANADTPGYKARDFDFARALQDATAGATPTAGRPSSTHPAHLGATGNAASTVSLAYRTPAQAALDGNTVEIDAERARFAENTVRYEATLKFLNGSLKQMLTAIQGQ